MKKPGEGFLEYKKRVLDPVSKSFCAAKWYNATIWLGSGRTVSCHHPPAHNISIDEIKKNPSALHNTQEKKQARREMLKGQRPQECEYCWKIEDIKRDNISDRVFKTMPYSDDDIRKIAEADPHSDVDLKTLEIAFDRACNFACSYCSSTYSTRWGQDIQNNGPYKNIVSEGRENLLLDGKWAQPYENPDDNPYIQAFWKWWPRLSQSLQELRITGGEPLMSKEVWKFFEFFKANPENKVRLAINSNLGAADQLVEKLIRSSHHVKHLDIYTSCEAVGDQAEYIRDGMDYSKYMQNIRKLLTHGKLRALHFMMTINSLCLFSITDFMDELLKLKSEFGENYGYMTFNILRHPSFMSPLALPDSIKRERKAHLAQWLEKNKANPLFHEMEKDSLQRLIDYLDVVKTPHLGTSPQEVLWQDFKSFYEQYDQRRGKNIRKTFPPGFIDWYDSIAVLK